MKKYFSILLALLYSTVTFAISPVQTEISAGYTYDDNVTRAAWSSDIEKDSIVNVDAAARYKIPFNKISYFSLKGSLELNQYLEFTKLSNTRLGLHGSYHIRAFSGYTATRYFALAAYERRLYKSEQRDGSAINIQLGLTKRLSDTVTLRAGYIKESVDAAETKGVFDSNNSRFYLDTDFKLGQKNTLYITLSRFAGDITSTSALPPEIIAIAGGLIVRDDAFLELTPDRLAYKLNATTNTIKLGDNYVLSSNQAIDASIFYYNAKTVYQDYSGMIFNLNYLYRF